MSSLTFSEILNQITSNYIEYKNNTNYSTVIPSLIKQIFPDKIREHINYNKYKVVESVGKGNISEIPWVAIINNESNFTPQRGIYLVFLFSSDMKEIYLSLNQGFYNIKDHFKLRRPKSIAKSTAEYLGKNILLSTNLSNKKIDLRSHGDLGKGYEAGNIFSIKYNINKIPDDNKIAKDVRQMIKAYESALEIVGNRDINDFYDYIYGVNNGLVFIEKDGIDRTYEIIENDEKNNKDKPEYLGTPRKKKLTIRDYSNNEKYPRDNRVAANALRIADFLCENEKEHKFFFSKKTFKNYTESHHLIPLNQHSKFEFSLDVEENICSLCSICHDCVHYGIEEDRDKILLKLYERRKEKLKEVGLNISFEELKDFY